MKAERMRQMGDRPNTRMEVGWDRLHFYNLEPNLLVPGFAYGHKIPVVGIHMRSEMWISI